MSFTLLEIELTNQHGESIAIAAIPDPARFNLGILDSLVCKRIKVDSRTCTRVSLIELDEDLYSPTFRAGLNAMVAQGLISIVKL